MESTAKIKKQKGFTFVSVIIGVIVSGILLAVGNMAHIGAYTQSQEVVVASHLSNQKRLMQVYSLLNYEALINANLYGDSDKDDYLADGVTRGLFDTLPWKVFMDADALTWEINAVPGSNEGSFSVRISSTNKSDQEMIDKALSIAKVDGSMVISR